MKIRSGFVSNSSSSSFIISSKNELNQEAIKETFFEGVDKEKCLFSKFIIDFSQWFYENLEKVDLKEKYEDFQGEFEDEENHDTEILDYFSLKSFGLNLNELHVYKLNISSEEPGFSSFLYDNEEYFDINFGQDICLIRW